MSQPLRSLWGKTSRGMDDRLIHHYSDSTHQLSYFFLNLGLHSHNTSRLALPLCCRFINSDRRSLYISYPFITFNHARHYVIEHDRRLVQRRDHETLLGAFIYTTAAINWQAWHKQSTCACVAQLVSSLSELQESEKVLCRRGRSRLYTNTQ